MPGSAFGCLFVEGWGCVPTVFVLCSWASQPSWVRTDFFQNGSLQCCSWWWVFSGASASISPAPTMSHSYPRFPRRPTQDLQGPCLCLSALLSMRNSRSIHFISNGIISFFFYGWIKFQGMYVSRLYPFLCWWTFRLLWGSAIIHSAILNIGLHGSTWIRVFVFSRCVPHSGIAGSYGISVTHYLRNLKGLSPCSL